MRSTQASKPTSLHRDLYLTFFSDMQASLAVGLSRSRNPQKAAEVSRVSSTHPMSSHPKAQAAVSVILNDIFDISHIVPQWDSKETENAVITHAYNTLVEDIKMISDALRVLQTSNPTCVVVVACC